MKKCSVYRRLIVYGMVVFLFLSSWNTCSDLIGDNGTPATSTNTPTHTNTPTPTNTPRPSITPAVAMGTIHVITTPVAGDILVDGDVVGMGEWSGQRIIGLHLVSFGSVDGYIEPLAIKAMVAQDETTEVEGRYVLPCYFVDITIDGEPWDGETLFFYSVMGSAEIGFTMINGEYWTATCDDNCDPATGYPGENTISFTSRFTVMGYAGDIEVKGFIEGNRYNCGFRIHYVVVGV